MGCRKLDWYSPEIEEARASDLHLFDSRMPVRRKRRKPELWKPPAAITLNAVTFHNSTAAASGADPAFPATITITKPTVSAGDILICMFGNNGGTTSYSTTAPSGWTLIGASITSTKVRTTCWWALQSVSNLGFTMNNDGTSVHDTSWVCLSFSGVDNVTPIDVTGTGNSNTGANSIAIGSATAATTGALGCIAITNFNSSSTFSATGFTVVGTANNGNCQASWLYANASTNSGVNVFSSVTVNDGAAASGNILCYQQFALRPSGGGGAAAAYPPRIGSDIIGRLFELEEIC